MSATSPLASVVIATHNRRDLLRGALESVAEQTLRDVEVVLVNDGGEDVADIVAELEDRLAIRYLSYSPSRERCAARNLALEHARGKYVAYLDDDDILYPQHLETLVGFLESTGEAVAYGDGVEATYVVAPDGSRTVVERRLVYSSPFDRDRFLYENYVAINCLVHRRDCLDRVGGFDVELGVPLEDWDLWIRLSRHWDFHHVPGVVAEFRTRVDREYASRLDRTPFYVNAQRVFVKYAEHVHGRTDLMRRQVEHLANLVHELEARAALAAEHAAAATAPLAGARAFTALAFADEIAADPALLADYGARFGAGDDATLVIYAPGWSAEELGARLGTALAAAGLDGDDSADLLAVQAADDSALAGRVHAVFSRREQRGAFERLPRVDDASRLRALAA